MGSSWWARGVECYLRGDFRRDNISTASLFPWRDRSGRIHLLPGGDVAGRRLSRQEDALVRDGVPSNQRLHWDDRREFFRWPNWPNVRLALVVPYLRFARNPPRVCSVSLP